MMSDVSAAVGGERTAVHGAGLLVDGFVQSDAVQQVEQRCLRQRRAGRQADVIDLFHQIAEHRALAASGGLGAPRGLAFDVGHAGARANGAGLGLPIHLNRDDVVDRRDQALVAQVANGERLGRRAQRHQRDEFMLVDIDRQRMLAGHRHCARFTMLIHGPHFKRRWPCGIGQQWAIGSTGGIHAFFARARVPGAGCHSMRDRRVAGKFSTADIAHFDFRRACRGRRAQFRIAVGTPAPDGGNGVADLLVAEAAAQQVAQIVTVRGEQAGVELALGRQPGARAIPTESLRHRGDDADFPAAVNVAPALRDLADVVGIRRVRAAFRH